MKKDESEYFHLINKKNAKGIFHNSFLVLYNAAVEIKMSELGGQCF